MRRLRESTPVTSPMMMPRMPLWRRARCRRSWSRGLNGAWRRARPGPPRGVGGGGGGGAPGLYARYEGVARVVWADIQEPLRLVEVDGELVLGVSSRFRQRAWEAAGYALGLVLYLELVGALARRAIASSVPHRSPEARALGALVAPAPALDPKNTP